MKCHTLGVTVPFWIYWTSPKKIAMALTIYRFWLGDVQWGHLMTLKFVARFVEHSNRGSFPKIA